MAAMLEANDYFVDMNELNVAAGKRAAELLGAEAALVTAGAFSAMMLGAAACLTGTDAAKVAELPHPSFGRRECLIQTCQRLDYDRAYRLAGATVVYADTRADIEARRTEVAKLEAERAQLEKKPPPAAGSYFRYKVLEVRESLGSDKGVQDRLAE